jgi:hypothetical protein
VRTTVDLPMSQHRRLRIEAAKRGITIKDLIRDLLEKEGIRNR